MTKNRNVVLRFIDGARLPLSGLRLLLRERRLWSLALVPLLLMLVVCGFGFSALFQFLPGKIALLVPATTTALGLMAYWSLLILGFALGFLTVGFLSIFLTKVLALPFYSLIAERSYDLASKNHLPSPSLAKWLHENIQMLRVSAVKAVLFFFVGLFLFAISLIPIINVFALLGGLFLLAFDCLDYILEVRRLRFRQRMRCLRQLTPEICGIATTLGIFLAVPGLSFVLIPATITGGAIFITRFDLKKVL